jgi:hypothetical protein
MYPAVGPVACSRVHPVAWFRLLIATRADIVCCVVARLQSTIKRFVGRLCQTPTGGVSQKRPTKSRAVAS